MDDTNLAVMLNQDLAVKTSGAEFIALMQKVSAYEVQVTNIKVTTDEEYQMGVDSLVAVAEVAKALEKMRKEIVSYPNTYVSTVNDMFRGLKQRCERCREKLGYCTGAYKDKKDAEIAKQQAEIEAARQAEVVDADAEEPIADAPKPPMPSNPLPTKGTQKGSVIFRDAPLRIEVVNAAKLVRAAVNDKNKVPVDVISIDASALRRAVEAKVMTVKQWEKYGVKVTSKKTMVVKT